MPQIGWTQADQAELDVMVWLFLGAAYAHQNCGDCLRLGHWCQPLTVAWDAIEAWMRYRRLLSRAQHLRIAQRIFDDACRLSD